MLLLTSLSWLYTLLLLLLLLWEFLARFERFCDGVNAVSVKQESNQVYFERLGNTIP